MEVTDRLAYFTCLEQIVAAHIATLATLELNDPRLVA